MTHLSVRTPVLTGNARLTRLSTYLLRSSDPTVYTQDLINKPQGCNMTSLKRDWICGITVILEQPRRGLNCIFFFCFFPHFSRYLTCFSNFHSSLELMSRHFSLSLRNRATDPSAPSVCNDSSHFFHCYSMIVTRLAENSAMSFKCTRFRSPSLFPPALDNILHLNVHIIHFLQEACGGLGKPFPWSNCDMLILFIHKTFACFTFRSKVLAS